VTQGFCWNCEEPLPENAHPRRKFCNGTCRSQYNRLAMSGAGVKNMAAARQVAKKLAFEKMEDEVREVLRDEIRKTINQHVRDNVLGSAEAMTALLPAAIASLAQDINDPDPIFRQRAVATLLKYTMGFADKGEEGDDSRIINIYHGVPVPEGPVGERMKTFIDITEAEAISDPSWPECYICHEEKHEDAGYFEGERFICRACEMRKKMSRPGNNLRLGDGRSDG